MKTFNRLSLVLLLAASLPACADLARYIPSKEDVAAGQTAAADLAKAARESDEDQIKKISAQVHEWDFQRDYGVHNQPRSDSFEKAWATLRPDFKKLNADGQCRENAMALLMEVHLIEMKPEEFQALVAPCAPKADPLGNAGYDVCSARLELRELKEKLAYQKRIEAESGVVDLETRRRLGQSIVRCQDDVAAALKAFKKVAGQSFDTWSTCDKFEP